jgi:hypothetical protein
MKVLGILEFDRPKDSEKLKKYYEYLEAKLPFLIKKYEEYNVKLSGWTDGTGHVVDILEMEIEDYAKVMSDEELQKEWERFFRHINNVNMRVLRPTLRVPPE